MFMLRASGALCLWLGASFMLAAENPGKYLPGIKLAAAMLLFYAAVAAAAGLLYKLPLSLFLADSGLAAIGGIVLLRFSRSSKPKFPL